MQADNIEEYYSLIYRLLDGEISDDELIRLKLWLQENPENLRIFDKVNEFWQLSEVCLNDNRYETDKSWTDTSLRLGIKKKTNILPSFLRWNKFGILVAAASIIILLGIRGFTLWIDENSTLEQMSFASTKITTHAGEKAHIILSDSTEITLNSETTLEYDGLYNATSRNIHLSGEAFFDVNTNPDKPFVVIMKGMKVSATGTQFNVCSFDNDDRVQITLEEGKIQVLIDGLNPIDVKEGQQVVYFEKSKNVLTQYVPADTYSSWKEGRLRFIDTPLEDVLRMIARKYNVGFEISSRDILSMKFTATILDEPIEEVMNMFSAVTSLTFKFKEQTSDIQSQKRKIVVGRMKQNR